MVTSTAWIPFAIGSTIIWSTDLIALLLAWKHRDVAPIKAKNLPLLTATLIASLFYWAGMSYSLGFFGKTRLESFLCSAVGLWMQFPFGLHLILGTLMFRYLRLYRALVLSRNVTRRWQRKVLLKGAFILLLFYIIISILVKLEAIPYVQHHPSITRDQITYCDLGLIELSISMLIAGTMIGTLIILSLRLRKPSASFKEYRETLHGVIAQTLSFVLTATLLLSGHTNEIWACYLLVFGNAIATDYYIWKVLGSALYGCVFQRGSSQRSRSDSDPILFSSEKTSRRSSPANSHESADTLPPMTSTKQNRFRAGLRRPSLVAPPTHHHRPNTNARHSNGSDFSGHILFSIDDAHPTTLQDHPTAGRQSVRLPYQVHAYHDSGVKEEELVSLAI
jgi:hypothetical protein